MIIARIFGWRSAAMNMCSVRQRPMPSAPNSRAFRASSGVSAFARTPSWRISSAHPSTCWKFSSTSGLDERHVVDGHDAAGAVDRDAVALVQHRPVHAHLARAEVDLQLRRARHRRAAHPARHERGVRRLAALAREDAARGEEPGHVVGLGERPHEHDVAALRRGLHRLLGREHDRALCRARRRAHAAREHLELGLAARRSGAAARRARSRRSSRSPPRARAAPRPPRRRRSARPPARAASRCASGACRGCPPPR